MIDQATFERYETARQKASDAGLALPEVLDTYHLLLTTQRHHDIEVSAVEDVIRRLDRQTPNKLMSYYYGRVDGTPAEMFAAMKMWLEAVCRNLANKTLEEL